MERISMVRAIESVGLALHTPKLVENRFVQPFNDLSRLRAAIEIFPGVGVAIGIVLGLKTARVLALRSAPRSTPESSLNVTP